MISAQRTKQVTAPCPPPHRAICVAEAVSKERYLPLDVFAPLLGRSQRAELGHQGAQPLGE